MARQLRETLTGVGEVYANDVLLRTTTYRLSVWWPAPADEAATALDTVPIDGHLDITGMSEAIVLAGPDSLTLKLEDGRRLPFTLTDTAGALGGRGPLA